MKNAIIGTTMVIVAVLISMIHMSVSTKDVRQNELNRSMNYAARTTVEVANSKKGKETIDTDQELMDQFNKNLLSQITSDSEIEVQFMGVNAAQGMLDVKAISHFTYPIGSPGQVQSRKTVIIDEIKEKGIMLGGVDFNGKFSKEIKEKITDVKFTDTLPRELENLKYGESKWDVSSLQDKSVIAWYEGTQLFIGSVGGVRTNTNMSGMFENFTTLKAVHFTNCDTENLVFMNRAFAGCTSLQSLDLGTLNTKNVVDMSEMFENCTSLTSIQFNDIETNVLSTVKGMFRGCTNLKTADLTTMDTSHVMNFDEMFKDCTNLETVKQNWNLVKAVSLKGIFDNCNKLNSLDTSKWKTTTIVSMSNAFRNCSTLSSIDISNWDVSSLENTNHMFANCKGLSTIDVSKWQTAQLKNVEGMFEGCSKVQSLDVHTLKMGSVTSLKDMFKGCTSLVTINANGWDTSEVTSLESFVDGSTQLQSIGMTGWKADSMTDWTYAFRNCELLKSLNLSDWNTSNLKVTIGAFEGCSSLSGTMIVKNLGITDYKDMFKNTATGNGAKFLVYDNGSSESYDFVESIVATKQNPDANVIHVSFNSQMVDSTSFHAILGDLTKTIETIEFSNEVPDLTGYQEGINKWDLSAKKDSSIVGWLDGNVLHIAGLNGVRANDKGGGLFANFTALKNVHFNNSFVTSNVTNFSYLFDGCTSLESVDLAGLDTSNGTTLKNMFQNCSSLQTINIPISTTRAETFENMFRGCSSLEELNLNSFNTSKVTNMREMFRDCNRLMNLNVQSFDTSKVTNMDGMFYQCQNLNRIVMNWKTENVTSMRWMFYNCMNLYDLDTTMWNTSNVTEMPHMFENCTSLQKVNISNWNTAKVTDMSSMFKKCINLETLDMRSIEWNSVTNTSSMFEQCEKLNGKVLINRTAWANSENMFLNAASNTELPVYVYCSNEATRDFAKALVATKGAESNKVYFVDFMTELVSGTFFNNMLAAEKENIQTVEFIDNLPNLSQYTYGVDKWDVSLAQDESAIAWMDGSTLFIGSLTEMVSNADLSNMFKGFTNVTTITFANLLNTTNITDMKEMFADCTQLTTIDTKSLNTKNVTNMAGLFKNCYMLSKVDISTWGTTKVTDMSSMFENCQKLESLDLRNFSTSSSTSLSNMFKGSTSLKTLDCSHFNTQNVTSIQSMFEGCTGLTSVNVKNWNTSKVTEMTATFAGCSNLASVDVSHFNVSNVFSTYRMFAGCTHLQSMDLTKWNLQNVQTMNSMFMDCSNLSAYVKVTKSMTPDYKDIFKNAATNPARRIFILDDQTVAGAELATRMEVSKANADSQVYHLKQNAKVKPGQEFNAQVRQHSEIKNIVFTDELPSLVDTSGNAVDMVENGNIFDFAVSELSDTHPAPDTGEGGIPSGSPEKYYNYSVLGWMDGDTLKIYSNGKAFANEDCSEMFWGDMLSIVFNNRLDTSKTTTMRGLFGGNWQLKSLDLSGFDTSNVTDMSNMFMKNLALEKVNVSSFDTSKVNNMNGMFSDCSKLKTLDLSSFNTSNVTNISGMFAADSSLTSIKGLENFDMRNVTNSSYMFSYVSSLQNARIDVTNPNSDVDMMYNKASTVPNSSFLVGYGDGSRDKAKEAVATKGTNTSNVHLIDYIVEFNPNGGSVNTNSVKIDYNKPVGTLPTPSRPGYRFKGWSKTKNGTEMVKPTDVLNEDCTLYAQWQSLEITLVHGSLFNSAIKAQNPNVTHIEFTTTAVPQDQIANATVVSVAGGGLAYMYTVDGVTYISPEEDGIKIKANADCSSMFKDLRVIENIQFDNFDTSQVTNMSSMFYYAGKTATTFNLDLSNWDTSQVTNMHAMFYRAGENSTTWNIDIHNWDTSKVTRMGRMFYAAGAFAKTWHLNANNLNTSQVTDMREMFSYAGQKATDWTVGDIGNWNTSKVTNMYRMFYCAAQNATTFNLDIHNWDVSQVVDMKEMFNRAGGNADTWILNTSNWNTSNVTSMYYMFEFAGQNAITFNIDVSNWNTSKVTDMDGMFWCTGQYADPFTLNLFGWDVTNVTNMSNMLFGIGANKILTPKNISKDVDVSNITSKSWYDETENYKEYTVGTFPVGKGNVSHTLSDEDPRTYILDNGYIINSKLTEIDSVNPIKNVVFTDLQKPSSGVTDITGLDKDGDGGVVGWYTVESDNSSKVYISTQKTGKKVVANAGSSNMFSFLKNIERIDFDSIETSLVTDMHYMFAYTGSNANTFIINGMDNFDTSRVTDMNSMFSNAGQNATTWSIGNLSNWNTSNVTDMNDMFSFAGTKASIIDIGNIGNWNVSKVTNTSGMFSSFGRQATTLNIGNIANWNTIQVTDMSYMFSNMGNNITAFNFDLSNWDTSQVTDMKWMFSNAGRNSKTFDIGNIGKWNINKVSDLNYMFNNAGYKASSWNIGNLSNWDTSNVTNMWGMFSSAGRYASTFNIGDLSKWNTSRVTDMAHMFSNAGQNANTWYIGNIGNWDTSQVTDMSYMFAFIGQKILINLGDLTNWDTSNAIKLDSMFTSCDKMKVILKISKPVENIKYDFVFNDSAISPESEIIVYDDGTKEAYDLVENMIATKSPTSNVTHGGVLKTGQEMMSILDPYMAKADKVLFSTTPPAGATNAIDISRDGNGTVNLWLDESTKVLHIYNPDGQALMANPNSAMIFMTMPMAATVKEIDFNNAFHTGAVTDMNSFFGNQKMLEKVNLAGIDTSNVTNMSNMFNGCTSLKALDVSSFNTSKVTSMTSMFKDCKALTSLDVSSFNTSNVTSMNYMFSGLKLLLLDLRGFDTSKVTNMAYMFSNSNKLINVYVFDNWNTTNVTISNGMFNNCKWLIGQSGKIYDSTIQDCDVKEANWENGLLKYKNFDNNLITFTIDKYGKDQYGNETVSRCTYEVPIGMTWNEFINSKYYLNSGNQLVIQNQNSTIMIDGENVKHDIYGAIYKDIVNSNEPIASRVYCCGKSGHTGGSN